MAVQNILFWATLSGRDEAVQLAQAAIIAKPWLAMMPFEPVSGMTFNGVRATVPTIGTSGFNQGVSASKGDITPVEFKVAMYTPRSEVNKRLADSFPVSAGGINMFRSTADELVLEGLLQGFANDLINASTDSNVNDFFGVQSYVNTLNGTTVVDGTGSSADSQTSIYFVKWGAKGVSGIFNESSGAAPSTEDLGKLLVTAPDGSGNLMTAYVTDFDWKAGVKVNPAGVGRLANIEVSSDVTLANMSLIKRHIKNGTDAIFTSRKGANFLDILSQNNLQTMVLDKELGLAVESFQGVPIFVDDSVLETEAVVTT